MLLVFLGILIAIIIYDIKYLRIPNKFVFLLFIIGSTNLLFNNINLIQYSIGLLFGFGLFFVLYLIFPKGIGFGDVKLAGAIGLFLGFKLTILAILLSFFSGAIVGLLLIALGKKTMKDPIPFGPFLALGAIASLFFGEYIIDWYMGLFI
ncbi:prepilin peptidase [Atribacter laminatus]|uniref:prepilin peptidase n=1 Tax=Atribacter laminatus TaxID=2847778 RepID=UPI001C408676|nr:A24 family peptidase [Atribacter laminatus]